MDSPASQEGAVLLNTQGTKIGRSAKADHTLIKIYVLSSLRIAALKLAFSIVVGSMCSSSFEWSGILQSPGFPNDCPILD